LNSVQSSDHAAMEKPSSPENTDPKNPSTTANQSTVKVPKKQNKVIPHPHMSNSPYDSMIFEEQYMIVLRFLDDPCHENAAPLFLSDKLAEIFFNEIGLMSTMPNAKQCVDSADGVDGQDSSTAVVVGTGTKADQVEWKNGEPYHCGKKMSKKRTTIKAGRAGTWQWWCGRVIPDTANKPKKPSKNANAKKPKTLKRGVKQDPKTAGSSTELAVPAASKPTSLVPEKCYPKRCKFAFSCRGNAGLFKSSKLPFRKLFFLLYALVADWGRDVTAEQAHCSKVVVHQWWKTFREAIEMPKAMAIFGRKGLSPTLTMRREYHNEWPTKYPTRKKIKTTDGTGDAQEAGNSDTVLAIAQS